MCEAASTRRSTHAGAASGERVNNAGRRAPQMLAEEAPQMQAVEARRAASGRRPPRGYVG
eukprot:346090-Chlamydomonas_euryale.AAC.14